MQQTIVALFNQRVEAERAREDLQNAGLSISDMHLISAGETPSGHFAQAGGPEGSEPRGFFDWLFGSDVPQADVERYHSYVNQGGKTLLSVRAIDGEIEFERIVSILDQHNPIDVGEDAAGQAGETAAGPADTAPTPTSSQATPTASSETVIPTAREELQVGKREATGTRRYRVRSYVVERPVEEQVALRDETVTVERRAPGGPAGEGGFEEKEVEVTERREEPVVAKVVKPGEDVVVRKDVADRVEKVRDKVRETKVDIDRAAAGNKPAATAPQASAGSGALAEGGAKEGDTTMDKNEVIATLNDLVETSKDGEYGFRTCADGVKNASLKAVFEEAARRCAEGAAQLEARIIGLGGVPEKGGSVRGSLHRGWVNIKSTVTSMDEAAVLAECERGEDVARRSYETALAKDLPADVRSLVERQYQGVKQNHDRVRALRNAAS